MERTENIGFGNLKLIQEEDEFRFGIDAVILADFANSISPGAENIVDMGTGNGIIPLILSHKNPKCRIWGVDVRKESVELARKSCALNGLEERIDFIDADIKDVCRLHPELNGRADMVVTNPPYVARGRGIISASDGRCIARHETTADLEMFIMAASRLVKARGDFFMVHRPSRLVDIFFYCRKYGLEPKHLRFVTPRAGEIPNIVLIHCKEGGGRELKLLKELPVYGSRGGYSLEINKIYERDR